ncbi:MAG: glycosyltransferase family 4 protein [Pseudomonadota bacterium]
MRILAIHRYFWPDTPPYASLLRAIVARWAKDGHEVDVLSSQPGYKREANIARQKSVETIDGFSVRRVSLPNEVGRSLARLWNVARFSIAILWQAVIRKRYDMIMVSTAPPVILGVVVRWACRLSGATMIYHCMDIHPEIGRISGEFRHPMIFKRLQNADTKTCEFADTVVVLSDDMANSIKDRKPGLSARFKIINNFELPSFETPAGCEPQADPMPAQREGVFRLLFAGNLGRFQGLDTVLQLYVESLAQGTLLDTEFWFMGDGKAKAQLVEIAGEHLNKRVFFLPHSPLPAARRAMQMCDAGLISLSKDIFRYAFPSKLMTYLSEGCTILAAIEKDSALATLIDTHHIGEVIDVAKPDEFIKRIEALSMSKEERLQRSLRIRSVSNELFSQEKVLDVWSELAKEVSQRVSHEV